MEDRAQLGQRFGGHIRARPFVILRQAATFAHLAAMAVGQVIDHLVGRDFGLEMAGGDGGTSPAVRLGSEAILRFAADFPLLRHLLGSQAHAVGNTDILVGREDGGLMTTLLPIMLFITVIDSVPAAIITSARPRRIWVGSIGHSLQP